MRITPLSVNFKGHYKEQYSDNISDDLRNRPRRLKPYLKQVAKHLPESDTLILTYCNDGLRLGHKKVKKFDNKSLLESDISLRYTKPIPQKVMLTNKTGENILRVLPVLLGKKTLDEINDKIVEELDFPTPYHEFVYLQENYIDDNL